MSFLWFKFLFLSVCYSCFGDGAKILFLSPIGAQSHKNFFMGISQALADAGHQITIVSTQEDQPKNRNIREVVIEADSVVDVLMERIFEDSERNVIYKTLLLGSPQLCLQSLADKAVQELKKEQFDLVFLSMFFDPCFLSLVHHFNVPFIHMYSSALFGHYTDMGGELQLSALYKNELIDEGHFPFSFLTRLKTTILDLSMTFVNNFHTYRTCDRLCREAGLCPPDMPPLKEISDNFSLVMVNSVRHLESPPRPSMPHVIHLGGIHCRPPNPLPKDLEDWVTSAENGFIFFSLGSAIIKPSVMPERFRKSLLKVFGWLKYKVLCKWDEEGMPDLPPNVKLGKWLPQQDILGHPNIKLFITHGGLLSRQEAAYHGVPIIGMPVYGDQYFNTQEIMSEGWGQMMKWEEFEEETFRNLIQEIIANDSYRDAVKVRSQYMKDRLISPSLEALYWTEHVLKHNGAPHMKSPILKLSSYQLFNLDVWICIGAFVVVVFSLIAWLILYFTRKLLKKLCKQKKD